MDRQAKLLALDIEKVKLRHAEVELSRAEVELKSTLVAYRIKCLAFCFALFGVPGMLVGMRWSWCYALVHWVTRVMG